MEPLAAGQLGGGSLAGVGVTVVELADCVMVTGALLVCMMVMGAPLSKKKNHDLADVAVGEIIPDEMSLPGGRG